MIKIDREHVEVSGNMSTILAEFTATITELNERYNKMPGIEKDLFLKVLLEGLEVMTVGGDKGA